MASSKCPIWGTPAEELPPVGDRHEYHSPRAGGWYAITGTVRAMWEHSPPTDQEKEHVTRLIAERRRDGEERPLIRSYDLPPKAA
jgi:hypothetical protein